MIKKKPYLKTVQTDTTRYLNIDTGELVGGTVKTRRIVVGSPNEFYKVFLSIESIIMGLGEVENKVFHYCCLHCSRENQISLAKMTRKDISVKHKVAESSIKKATALLVKRDLLKKMGGGSYMVNPQYVCKTDESARRKLLEYSLTIEQEDPS